MTIKDTNLAITLISLGHKYRMEMSSDNKSCLFIFEDSMELEPDMDAYWNKELLVEPLSYSNTSRQVMMRIKNMIKEKI